MTPPWPSLEGKKRGVTTAYRLLLGLWLEVVDLTLNLGEEMLTFPVDDTTVAFFGGGEERCFHWISIVAWSLAGSGGPNTQLGWGNAHIPCRWHYCGLLGRGRREMFPLDLTLNLGEEMLKKTSWICFKKCHFCLGHDQPSVYPRSILSILFPEIVWQLQYRS